MSKIEKKRLIALNYRVPEQCLTVFMCDKSGKTIKNAVSVSKSDSGKSKKKKKKCRDLKRSTNIDKKRQAEIERITK